MATSAVEAAVTMFLVVLLVPGRVRDDQSPSRGGHEPIGDIDGDPLFPLRGETIGQQRQIKSATGRARHLRVALKRGELILVDLMGLPYSSRPSRVLLPSSTLPQVINRT